MSYRWPPGRPLDTFAKSKGRPGGQRYEVPAAHCSPCSMTCECMARLPGPSATITQTFRLYLPYFHQTRRPNRNPLCILKSNELLTRQEAAGGNHAVPSAEGRKLNHMI